MEKDRTTIQVTKQTLERLRHRCVKGRSYDEFINELLDNVGYKVGGG